MNAWAWFVIGLTVGSVVTVMLLGLMRSASEADELDRVSFAEREEAMKVRRGIYDQNEEA